MRQSTHEYFLWDWFTAKLSSIIRSVVFSDTARCDKRTRKTYIAVQEMDDEEYGLWLEMVEKVLTVLDDGARRRQEMLERRSDNGKVPERTAD